MRWRRARHSRGGRRSRSTEAKSDKLSAILLIPAAQLLVDLALVSLSLPFIGCSFALIGFPFAFTCRLFALVGELVSLVGQRGSVRVVCFALVGPVLTFSQDTVSLVELPFPLPAGGGLNIEPVQLDGGIGEPALELDVTLVGRGVALVGEVFTLVGELVTLQQGLLAPGQLGIAFVAIHAFKIQSS